MSWNWTVTPEQAWGALAEAEIARIEAEIVALCESLLDPIEAWMRENHGWQNHTGAAEAGLYSDLIHVAGRTVTIIVQHGPTITYSEWLETVRGGELGVIAEAVEQWAPKVFHGVMEILSRRGS